MSGARGGLEEGGIDIREVLDLEYPASRIRAVLGKATVHGDTVSLEVFTEQLVSTAAVEAFTTKLRVIGDDPLADFKALDLGANSRNDTNSFVT